MTKALLSTKETCEYLGIKKSSLHSRQQKNSKYYDPSFPSPVRFGQRDVKYVKSELDDWISSLERGPREITHFQKEKRNAVE